jgi:hypothetical protein
MVRQQLIRLLCLSHLGRSRGHHFFWCFAMGSKVERVKQNNSNQLIEVFGMNTSNARYDADTLAALRSTLDEVLLDRTFLRASAVSALEVAEHLLAQAALGQRDRPALKASALQMLDARMREKAA